MCCAYAGWRLIPSLLPVGNFPQSLLCRISNKNISAMGNEFLTSFFSFFVQGVRLASPSSHLPAEPFSKGLVLYVCFAHLSDADACLFFCACTNGNSNLRQQLVLSSSPYPCTFVIHMFHTSLRYACVGGGFNTNFTHSDILEPCTLIHFGWWEISIENQNVWGREILVSSIFVGLCSLSMCTYSDVVGVI